MVDLTSAERGDVGASAECEVVVLQDADRCVFLREWVMLEGA